MNKEKVLLSFLLMFHISASILGNDLFFQAGFDTRARTSILYINDIPYYDRQIQLKERLQGVFYAGFNSGDFMVRFNPLLDERFSYSRTVLFSHNDYWNYPYHKERVDLLDGNRFNFFADYKNRDTDDGWVRLEEATIGDKWPSWSEARFFTDLDSLNAGRDFYYMDNYAFGLYGVYTQISFLDRLFLLEGAAAVGDGSYNFYAIKLGVNTGAVSASAYAGNAVIKDRQYSWHDPRWDTYQMNGLNITYKSDSGTKIYFEAVFPRIESWNLTMRTVAGAQIAFPDSITLTAEVNYYGDGLRAFAEASYPHPFGWQSWEADASAIYFPGGVQNVVFMLGFKNTDGIFRYEFRYAYESAGNHKLDINLRLFGDLNINLSGTK